MNMVSKDSKDTREISVDLINDNPDHIRKYLDKNNQTSLRDFNNEFKMPKHHPVLDMDISNRGWKILKKAYEYQPENYEELISLKGLGAKRIRALALVSDLIYGSKVSWEDPVKYSFTHGGKDGTPYPVNKEVYDSTINSLREMLDKADVDGKDKYRAFKRLESFINYTG